MGMVLTPQGSALTQTAPCVICEQERKLVLLSAGMHTAAGEQAYACDVHFRDTRTLIIGWTKYAANQRLEKLIQFGLAGGDYGPSVY